MSKTNISLLFKDILIKGTEFYNSGDILNYQNMIRAGANIVKKLLENKYYEHALAFEIHLYNKLVCLFEQEENHFLSFSHYSNNFFDCGKSLSSPYNQEFAPNQDCAFVIHNNSMLGHTEVMCQILLNSQRNRRLTVIPLNQTSDTRLDKILSNSGINLVYPPKNIDQRGKFFWIRGYSFFNQITNAIWVSAPPNASFALGIGLAQRQLFWSLRFHAIWHPNVLHIGLPKVGSGDFDNKNGSIIRKNGNDWVGFKAPMKSKINVDSSLKTTIKERFQGFYIFGTVSRSTKLTKDFINCVGNILQRCQQAVFIIGTDAPLADVIMDESLKTVVDRIHNFGWVDSPSFNSAIDCYLEPFPFGTGITGRQALEVGCLLNSLWDRNTLPHFYFKAIEEQKQFSANWRATKSVATYIENAISAYEGDWVREDEDIALKFNELDGDPSADFFEIVDNFDRHVSYQSPFMPE